MQSVALADHQRKAVAQLHNGSILTGGVGTGKTRVAIRYYIENESQKDIYVITTAKKRDSLDWVAEALAQGVSTESELSFAGQLHVDSWNSIGKYVDVEGAFFVFDEQRLVGSGKWVKSFYQIARKNNWILLSATPGDTWLDYIPVFVANGFYKNQTEFIREHVVYSRFSKFPKVDKYIGVNQLVKNRNQLLVDMPYERHTTRVINDVLVDYDQDLFQEVVTKRWNPYENRPQKDVAELYSVMRRIVNSDQSRVEAVRKLMMVHPRLIVFYNFNYELEALRMLADGAQSHVSSSTASSPLPRSKSAGLSYLQTKSPLALSPIMNECPIAECDTCRDLDRSGDQKPSVPTMTSSTSCPLTGSTCQCMETESEMCLWPSRSHYQDQLRRVIGDQKSLDNGTTGSTVFPKRSSDQSTTTSKNDFENLSSISDTTRQIHHEDSLSVLVLDQSNGTSLNQTDTPQPKFSKSTMRSSESSSKTGTDQEWTRNRIKDGGSKSQTTKRVGLTDAQQETGTDTPSSLIESAVSFAEWNGQKHEPIPDTERWVYLVQYTAGAEGWNCVQTDTVVFFSLNYSYRIFEQCQGRIDRLNTPYKTLNYYVLKSDSKIDKTIWKALILKKNFNERSALTEFVDKKDISQ